ncbi:hypothetical protein PT974_05073 [Cladobotryum mycophilum]|uniref:Ricin B lectin domain-containing protein n=1 Tax=Cladobotryum mycophilum TaxID=491253 RepID=A0ABR0SRB6_9HYPO
MMYKNSLLVLLASAFASASPVDRRAVQSLNQAAFQEAQQRDNTATRAFSNVQIKTSDGKCLRVDKLSGDFRANLTPIQIVQCGSTNGQGWDIITAGKHNDQKGQMLIVSTLTQACFNVDPRRPAGNQVNLFSCGGRADGSGQVTNSQLFAFAGGSGPLGLQPENAAGQCLFVSGNSLGIQACNSGSASQSFTFGGSAGDGGSGGNGNDGTASASAQPVSTASTGVATHGPAIQISSIAQPSQTTLLKATSTAQPAATSADHNNNGAPTSGGVQTTAAPSGAVPTADPTSPVPVSRAGGVLNPSAAAESNQFDDTAKRAVESANIRAPDGRCLSIDPTAGDFRQNLIPVQLAKCNNDPNQKFDIVTKGKHNDGTSGAALIVSVLTNGCVSFDGRRPAGDTVTLFSCGGRADGGGDTNVGQLFPYKSTATDFVMKPLSENGKTCLTAGPSKVDSGACDNQKDQVFEITYVL